MALQWQLWLVLGLACLLRLPALARSPFSSDDALLFLEAIRSVHDGLLPATSIFSSLLALNMPFYTWLLLPFATHPLGMAIITCAADILTVAGLYIFGARYFGRLAGLIAGLLYATAMYPTWFSQFIWEPTIVPPLLLGVFFTLYLGAVDGKRHWLPLHAILLAALIQIYPLTATLLPLTLFGIIFGWRAIHWLDIPLSLLGPALLFIPTYLFEIASGGYDVHVYLQYLQHHQARIDSQVLAMLQQAIGALPGNYFGDGTLYARVAPSFAWLGTLLMVLLGASVIWLLCTILYPRLARRRLDGAHDSLADSHNARSVEPVTRRERVKKALSFLRDRGWRSRLLLAIWPLSFLSVTIRHAPAIYIHYVSIVLPIAYLIIGFALAELPAWLALSSGGLISAAQAIATGSFILVLASGQATAASWGGIPIESFNQAVKVANLVAERVHSSDIYLVADPGDPYMGQYWAEEQNLQGQGGSTDWTSYATPDCALTAPAGAGSSIILSTTPPGPAMSELLNRPGTHLIERVPMARGAQYPVYQIAANDAGTAARHITLNGELQLDGVSLEPARAGLPERIVSDWTVLYSTPPNGNAVPQYSFKFVLNAPTVHGLKGYQDVIQCAPSSWIAGEGIVLVLPLPSEYQALPRTTSLQLRIHISRDTHYWYQPEVNRVTLETAKELTTPSVLLPIGAKVGPGWLHATRNQVNSSTITALFHN